LPRRIASGNFGRAIILGGRTGAAPV
jgi:hypothetical protein